MNSPNEPNDERLAALIAELPPHRAPEGWRDSVLAAIDAGAQPTPTESPTPTPTPTPEPTHAPAPRKRVQVPAWLYPALAAAAAVMIYLGLRPTKPIDVAPLAMQVTPASSEPMRGDATEANVGDDIKIPAAHGAEELRVYLDDQLILRCPGDDRCLADLSVKLRATEPGNLTAAGYAPPLTTPTAGQKQSADISAAARVDGIRRFEYKPLRIR